MNGAHGDEDMSAAGEASLWDARLRAPDCSESDRAGFAEWKAADPTHRLEFERLQAHLELLRQNRNRADLCSMREAALATTSVWSKGRRFVGWAAGLAVIGITGSWLLSWQGDLLERFLARFDNSQTFVTQRGQRSVITLEDGSTLDLNAESRAKVDFSKSERTVSLEAGQALFTVARNAHRPFVVHAAQKSIVAIGTQFDVRLDERFMRVTLVEGKVRVAEEPTAPLLRAPSPGAADLTLAPGQQLVSPVRASLHSSASEPSDQVRTVDTSRVVAWKDGRIFLDDMPLLEAIAEMNRHSAMQIRLATSAYDGERINGMFYAGRQETFMNALLRYFPDMKADRHKLEIVLSKTALPSVAR